jgi:predicted small secreted protein
LKRWLVLVLLVTGIASLGACRTMQGLGQDISAVGDKISDKASRKTGD